MAAKKDPGESMDEAARDQVELDKKQGTNNAAKEYERLSKLEDKSEGNERARQAYEDALFGEKKDKDK